MGMNLQCADVDAFSKMIFALWSHVLATIKAHSSSAGSFPRRPRGPPPLRYKKDRTRIRKQTERHHRFTAAGCQRLGRPSAAPQQRVSRRPRRRPPAPARAGRVSFSGAVHRTINPPPPRPFPPT